jgi:hypothetical protein
MNVVFVLDSSASMLQRTPQNLTYLDAAKMAIDNFLKVRHAERERPQDRQTERGREREGGRECVCGGGDEKLGAVGRERI